MEVIRRERRARKQLVCEALGISGRFDRIWASQVEGLLQDTRLASLPPDPNPLTVSGASATGVSTAEER